MEIGRLPLLLLAAALVAAAPGPGRAPRYNPQRLPNDRLAAMVERPIAHVEAGHAEAGYALFEDMLGRARARHGADSLAVADLLIAFGVQLYAQGTDGEDRGLAERSLLYLRRAADAYRAAVGPDHPEVAVALNSWADVERQLRPDSPAAAESALEEAYRIRAAALGPSHKDTLWTRLYLAQVRGRSAWTGDDPVRIGRISADLLEVAALSRASDAGTRREMPLRAQLQRVELYARHRQVAGALAALTAAQEEARRAGDGTSCWRVANAAGALEETLGDALAARRVELNRMIADQRALCELMPVD